MWFVLSVLERRLEFIRPARALTTLKNLALTLTLLEYTHRVNVTILEVITTRIKEFVKVLLADHVL